MGVIRLVKTPLRAARSVFRTVRDLAGLTPADPTPPPTTTGRQTTPEPAPAPAAPPSAQAAPAPEPSAAPAVEAPREPLEVEVEPTPNPDALKFVCNRRVVERGSLAFDSAEAAADVPMARDLFAIGGVRTVFAVRDFVTITRTQGTAWESLHSEVIAVLEQHLS